MVLMNGCSRRSRLNAYLYFATLGVPIVERQLTRYDIFVADECFLTGTAAEVIPVVELDRRKIGEGKPGPVTRRFITAFKDLAGSTGTPID